MLKNQIKTRVLSRAAIAIVLGLAAVGLTQCRLTSDNVTGVDVSSSDQSLHGGRNTCLRRCEDAYQRAIRQEIERYRNALCKCDRMKKSKDRKDCRDKEKTIHARNIQKIKNDKEACKRKCYNEGGGHGGR